MNRIERSLQQPLYLLDYTRDGNDWNFYVQGFSGKNYNVGICPTRLNCECVDFKFRKKLCKHVYFIIGKILGDKECLPRLENNNIFTVKPQFTEKMKAVLEAPKKVRNKSDPCTICYENIGNTNRVCRTCSNQFHVECIVRWLKIKNTCPLCRQPI